MRDDAVLRRALPLGRGLGRKDFQVCILILNPNQQCRSTKALTSQQYTTISNNSQDHMTLDQKITVCYEQSPKPAPRNPYLPHDNFILSTTPMLLLNSHWLQIPVRHMSLSQCPLMLLYSTFNFSFELVLLN